MKEVLYNVGEVFFFAKKGRIEKHTITGSFELNKEVNYVFTPLGNIASTTADTMFKTFEDAKASLLDSAKAELGRVESIVESCVVWYPSVKPTEKELQADDEAHMDKAIAEAEATAEDKED